jgi:hypothetical protein
MKDLAVAAAAVAAAAAAAAAVGSVHGIRVLLFPAVSGHLDLHHQNSVDSRPPEIEERERGLHDGIGKKKG